MSTGFKAVILSLIVAASIATPALVRHNSNARLREKTAALRQLTDRLVQLTTEDARLSNLVGQAKPALSDEQFRELMRLRGEVGTLRRQSNAIQGLRDENRRLAERSAAAQKQQVQITQAELDEQLSAETLEAMRNICLELGPALQKFADDHTNRAPDSLVRLRNYFSASGGPVAGLYSLRFVPEKVPIVVPGSALILSESGLHRKPDGKWARYYAYGDGRIVEAIPGDEDFDAWEKQHMISPVPPGQ